jgi:hypothetical protein
MRSMADGEVKQSRAAVCFGSLHVIRCTTVTCNHPRLLLLQMSLQGLISGSECAVPSNPLAQVLKHTEGDRSLQQVCILQAPSGNQIVNRLGSGSGRRTFIVSGTTVSSTPAILALKHPYSYNICRGVRQLKLQNGMPRWQGNFSEDRSRRQLHLLR